MTLTSFSLFSARKLARATAFTSCLLLAYGVTAAGSSKPAAPAVSLAAASQWQTAEQPPAGWVLQSEFPASLVSIDSVTALRIDSRPGSLSTLQIPYPSLMQYPFSVIKIRIGAIKEDGRGLHWFLKKGPFELRADDHGIFLAHPTTKERERIGAFKPGVIQTITLEYTFADKSIRAVSVDGVPAQGVTPRKADSLASAGKLSLFAATHSGSDPLFVDLAVYADASVIADAPRWMTPQRGEEDPQTTGALPSWEPVADAQSIEFKLNPERLANPRFSRGILFNPTDLATLAEKIDSDPAMREFWERSTQTARDLLEQGQLSLPENEASRMTYMISGLMPRLGIVYATTGNPELGRLVRHLILDLANRPAYFWVHSELRKYDPSWPVGQLECAELARSLSLTVQWCEDLFSTDEMQHIQSMIQQKGLDPSLRWIETRGRVQKNNYLAVIGGGALITAIAQQDKAAEELAMEALQNWLTLVEPDGSYGEPQGYFEYGFSRFLFGWWALGHERGKELLQDSPLRGSLEWMIYYFVRAERNGITSAWRVNFGDDDFLTGPHGGSFFRLTSESLAYAFDDGLGTWISKNLIHPEARMNVYEFLFRISKAGSDLPQPVSPEQKKLPLARTFDNGLGFIRSGWSFDNDTLFAIRSGGAALTGYSHDRPNRNAFVLFSHGDYLAIAPGRSSYRSPLYRGWDIPTTSHNTIAIDGKSQIRNRQAEFTALENTDTYVRISSEAKDSYADNIAQTVARTVWYIKALDAFVIEDQVALKSPAIPSWHLLLSNLDRKSSVSERSPSVWQLARPTASLSFSLLANQPLNLSERKGYMHTGYSYYPGSPREGTEGSAFSLTWQPRKKVADICYYTLLLPSSGTTRADAPADQLLVSPQADGSLASWAVNCSGHKARVSLHKQQDGSTGLRID